MAFRMQFFLFFNFLFFLAGYQISLFEGMVQIKELKWIFGTTYREGKSNPTICMHCLGDQKSLHGFGEVSLRLSSGYRMQF
jgi:hypothetical protein